jgi:AraC-like DNA-binding protein
MIVRNLWNANESYTLKNWVFRDLSVGFSRLYYILDGEAYYEEDGKKIRLKKNHLYLTPVKRSFSLYDNPDDQLLHTYTHITTLPTVTELYEREVVEGTPLFDAVAMWRKYIHSGDGELLHSIINLILSLLGVTPVKSLAEEVRRVIESSSDTRTDMQTLAQTFGYCREHLCRVFFAAYGETPTQYATKRRMTAAVSMLLEGASVTECAARLGYATPYAFSKAFKKHFGLSPREHLKMCESYEENVP